MRVHKCPASFLSELTKMENLKKFLLKIETKQMRITLTIQRLLIGAKKRRCMSMSKKRLLSIVISAVIYYDNSSYNNPSVGIVKIN